jgi:hypothetical protein
MPLPIGWDPVRAVEAVTPIAVRGEVYRAHLAIRDALNANSHLYTEGRFNRGGPHLAPAERWSALYLSSAAHIALGEYTRHLANLSHLRGLRISRIHVELTRAGNCLDLATLHLTEAQLLGSADDYSVGQALAAAAIDAGYEAIVVPTATRFQGHNLVVFPDHLRPGSAFRVRDYEEPHLYQGVQDLATGLVLTASGKPAPQQPGETTASPIAEAASYSRRS